MFNFFGEYLQIISFCCGWQWMARNIEVLLGKGMKQHRIDTVWGKTPCSHDNIVLIGHAIKLTCNKFSRVRMSEQGSTDDRASSCSINSEYTFLGNSWEYKNSLSCSYEFSLEVCTADFDWFFGASPPIKTDKRRRRRRRRRS